MNLHKIIPEIPLEKALEMHNKAVERALGKLPNLMFDTVAAKEVHKKLRGKPFGSSTSAVAKAASAILGEDLQYSAPEDITYTALSGAFVTNFEKTYWLLGSHRQSDKGFTTDGKPYTLPGYDISSLHGYIAEEEDIVKFVRAYNKKKPE